MARSGVERWLSSSSGRRVAVLLPLVLVLDLFLVLALGLLPLGSISGLRCDALLRGGDPKPDLTLAPMIRASSERLCNDAASGRRNLLIAVGVMVLVFGAGAVLTPADRLERALVPREDDDDDGWEPEPGYVPSYAQPQAAYQPPARSWLRPDETAELTTGDAGPLALTAGGGTDDNEAPSEDVEVDTELVGDMAVPVDVVEEEAEPPDVVDEAAAKKAARAEKARAARARAKAAKAATATGKVAKASKPARPAAKVVRARQSRAGKTVVSARGGKSTKTVIARSVAPEPVVEAPPEVEPEVEASPVILAEPLAAEAAPTLAAPPSPRQRAGKAATKRAGTRLGTRRSSGRGGPARLLALAPEPPPMPPEAPEPDVLAEPLGPGPEPDLEPAGVLAEPLDLVTDGGQEPAFAGEPPDLATDQAEEPGPSSVAVTEAVPTVPPGDEPAWMNAGPLPSAEPKTTRAQRLARAAGATRPVASTRSRLGRGRPAIVTTPFDGPAEGPGDAEDETPGP